MLNDLALEVPMSKSKPLTKTISEQFVKIVCERLAENNRVRRTLPIWGRLHIDRQLPFLCVYRQPRSRRDFGTEHFILGEASYLTISGERKLHEGLQPPTKGNYQCT